MTYTGADHTFVLCAYKESPYLEECLSSLVNQTVHSSILIATSTPNKYISDLGEKYKIPIYVSNEPSDICTDWNFAYAHAKTPLITIAHQDDVYCETYVQTALYMLNCAKNPLIFFSDYSELRNGQVVSKTKNLTIKRLMLWPLKRQFLQNSKWVRRRILSLGCPIGCPAVTFVKNSLPNPVFTKGFKSDLDWQAWERISRLKGSFVYTRKTLMYHRIHQDSATTEIIGDSLRNKEDYQMYCCFWPKWIAKLLAKSYAASEKSNQIKS